MKKYVLELTPLNRSKSSLDLLLLGDWCKNDRDRKSTTVSYHWNDRRKLRKDYEHISELFDKYLIEITKGLNQAHDLDYDTDYWKIIIGPWLYYFISIVFDRYEMLKYASDHYEIDHTNIPNYETSEWIPLDYTDFNYKFYSDGWNYYIYSEIIRLTGIIKSEKTDFYIYPEKKRKENTSFFKSFLFFLTKITRIFPRRITFVETDYPQKSLYNLLYKLKDLRFSYYIRVKPDEFESDRKIRLRLSNNFDSQGTFESILDYLIPRNIPLSYLEGFKKLEKDSYKIFPKKTKIIFTSNAYFSNEHFKVWASNQRLKETKLWVMVHGGHHGTASYNGPGELTEDISDRFYCWGWGEYNLPAPKLSILKGKKKNKDANKILFLSYNISRYSNHIDSSPISSSYNDCINKHCLFFEKLKSADMIDKVLVRHKSRNSLWDVISKYKESGVKNFIYSEEEPLKNSFSRSELVIVSYDSTAFLESLTMNIPTCLFIREECWEMSKSSKIYFDKFLDCGILHHDENSLMDHIQKVKDDYDLWWQSDLVQISIKLFLKKFGLASQHWQKDWYDELQGSLPRENHN